MNSLNHVFEVGYLILENINLSNKVVLKSLGQGQTGDIFVFNQLIIESSCAEKVFHVCLTNSCRTGGFRVLVSAAQIGVKRVLI